MSKRSEAIEIMNANADKEMTVVVKLIAAKIGVSEGNAKSYYRYIVANNLGKGNVTKTAKVKATKEKQNFAAKLEKSIDEISKVKAKNLETIKATHKKYNQVARVERDTEVVSKAEMKRRKAEVENFSNYETDELPSFRSPEKLTRDEVKYLV
jgi:hypothetical protein